MSSLRNLLICLATQTLSSCSSSIPLNIINYYCPSLFVNADDTVSSLYDRISSLIPSTALSRDISIVFKDKIILNFRNDHLTVNEIGISTESNEIQIIKKPDCAALLEMISNLGNIRNIPWLHEAINCISNPKAIGYGTLSHFGGGLDYDENVHLIGINLSHLNLTGTIDLESLPHTVRSLDLSFNDLDSLHLDGLRGKSVEKLNVENNGRYHIDTERFRTIFGRDLPIRELRISSNQIFPQTTDLVDKDARIKQWLSRRQTLERMMVDGIPIFCGGRSSPMFVRMLNVVNGVTNKELIPWYKAFADSEQIHHTEWVKYRIDYKRRRGGLPAQYRFNLSGLGLEGHIDLGYLPRNILVMNLSSNNLSSVSFAGEGKFNLRVLDIHNNDRLSVNLADIDQSSRAGTLSQLVHLQMSWNQLQINAVSTTAMKHEYLLRWMTERQTELKQIVVDDDAFPPNLIV